MKKSTKRIVISAIVAVMCACSATSAFAASSSNSPVIDENNPSASYQQKITYTKSEDEIVPYYTVTIPQTIELQKAEYLIYNSDAFANPTYYGIGDEIVSWEGSNWGTVTRKIKLKDYHNTAAGSYNGVINYSVSLENK